MALSSASLRRTPPAGRTGRGGVPPLSAAVRGIRPLLPLMSLQIREKRALGHPADPMYRGHPHPTPSHPPLRAGSPRHSEHSVTTVAVTTTRKRRRTEPRGATGPRGQCLSRRRTRRRGPVSGMGPCC